MNVLKKQLTYCLFVIMCLGACNGALAAERKTIVFKIYGMTCQFCVYGVQKKLKKVPGVERAKVSLKNKAGLVVVKKGYPLKKIVADVKQAVRDSGYMIKNLKVR